MWHKEKGVQGFHLVQSFAPGEASPELAHQIGQEFAQKLLNGKFPGHHQHPLEYQMPAQPPGLELGIPYKWKEVPEQSKIIHYPNTPDFR
ncbi:MAG: relaxase/mobilization nuclease domain-containing protein [[Clostridium] leptum]